MNGARMRSYSLSGTRPAKISASVPRLIAPCSARTRTLPARERRQRFVADFGPAGPDIPERLRDVVPIARHARGLLALDFDSLLPLLSCTGRQEIGSHRAGTFDPRIYRIK